MPDENDSALTGAAFELANAGYRPMPERDDEDKAESIGSDSASLREAAEQRAGSPNGVTVRQYINSNGKPVAANEAVTLDRAGRDYARAAAADIAAMENQTSAALAARVDALRAEALAKDPDAAEFYGFEPLQAKIDEGKTDDTDPRKTANDPGELGDPKTTGLDPEIEKVINHPQVRAAIEERIGEAEQSRQDYLNGLAAATQIAQVSFLSQFPELASVAPENMPAAYRANVVAGPAKIRACSGAGCKYRTAVCTTAAGERPPGRNSAPEFPELCTGRGRAPRGHVEGRAESDPACRDQRNFCLCQGERRRAR